MDYEEICKKIGDQLQASGPDQDNRQQLHGLIIRECGQENPEASRRLEGEFFGFGPLAEILNDSEITEILVNGPSHIWLERQGTWKKHNDSFLSRNTFDNFIHRFCHETQMIVDLNTPCADGQWRDFRVHMVRPPLTPTFQISLRRHPDSPWTLSRLGQVGWASDEEMALLKNFVRERNTFLIVGPTGSGKTSVLNACMAEVPANERIVCIEDTSEIALPNSASCKLLTRHDPNGVLRNYDLSDLVRQSLRMRPSRLVVGEVRGGEARDLLLALATGHMGSMGTLHAEDAKQALLRLEMLVQMGAPGWSSETVRQLIHFSVKGIIVCGQRSGRRFLEGLYKLGSLERFGILLEKLI